MSKANRSIPLCIDLDGSLTLTDTLHESILMLAGKSPLTLLRLPLWIAGGKASFKSKLADRVDLDAGSLPYHQDVLTLIEQARAADRPVVLATAAPRKVAEAVAAHLGVFDSILSTDPSLNLSGECKAAALVARFGVGGFDYVGNSADDVAVLRHARRGFLITSSRRLRQRAMSLHSSVEFMEGTASTAGQWAKAIRVHQWMKNALIFVPTIAAHHFDSVSLLSALLAFMSFSLCASAVYLLNDMLDLRSDRLHQRKKSRPFASGAIPVAHGMVAAPSLLMLSLILAAQLPLSLFEVLIGYAILTTAYSFWLKRLVVVDIILLAMLYTTRLIAGSAATYVEPSFWLLALSMFLFLSLATVKRYTELLSLEEKSGPLAGRGYVHSDLAVIMSLGTSSGLIAVLILAMYTQAQNAPMLYPSREWLWLAPPLLLYWITRVWMLAHRGLLHDDPVVFAARDWNSQLCFILMLVVFGLASQGWHPW